MTASIRSRVKNQVSVHSRTTGTALARWGGVALLHVSRGTVVAEVKQKEIVEVRLRDGRVEVACSCKLHTLGLVGCRHVWATLTAIERTGALGTGGRAAGGGAGAAGGGTGGNGRETGESRGRGPGLAALELRALHSLHALHAPGEASRRRKSQD